MVLKEYLNGNAELVINNDILIGTIHTAVTESCHS